MRKRLQKKGPIIIAIGFINAIITMITIFLLGGGKDNLRYFLLGVIVSLILIAIGAIIEFFDSLDNR